MRFRIGIVGDYRKDFAPHTITEESLTDAATASGIEAVVSWLSTDRVRDTTLQEFDALWIAPGSPYRDMEGALTAIGYARKNGVPLAGACAGFQHVILEYARNVLGFADAVHAEYDPPPGSRQVLAELSCSIAGKELPVTLAADSLASKIWGRERIVERYYCKFGLNPEYRNRLGDLRVSGRDDAGEARVVELPGHPFFMAALFVPQSTARSAHPMAMAFLESAMRLAGKVGV
jgi:CTP synthase (UTP-ammonia lyase)